MTFVAGLVLAVVVKRLRADRTDRRDCARMQDLIRRQGGG